MPKYLKNDIEKQKLDIVNSFQKLRKYFPALDSQR